MTNALTRLCDGPVWSFHNDGSVFDLGAPAPTSVCFDEMGEVLSGLRRFNGRGIPVSQHSVMGAQAILNEGGTHMEAALYFLHDGHEWALGDIIRPTEKLLTGYLNDCHGLVEGGAFSLAVHALKLRWDNVIYAAASLPAPEHWSKRQAKVVKAMDDRMCREEAIFLFGTRAASQFPKSERPKTTGTLKPWGQAVAAQKFAEMAQRLIGGDQLATQAALARATRQRGIA